MLQCAPPQYRTYTPPLTSSHASLASTNIDHIVDIENHNTTMSSTAPSVSRMSVASVSTTSSRRSSNNRVTFSPGLIAGPTKQRKRPNSLPLVSVLVHPESRKRSTQSEGGDPMSDPIDVAVANNEAAQRISINSNNNEIVVANNLNSQRKSQPMM